MIFSSRRYDLDNTTIKVESMIRNLVQKDTGSYFFPFHKHDDFLEISLIVNGEETIEYESGSYRAVPGDIVIKNAGALHQELAGGAEDLEELSIGLSGIRILGLPENCILHEEETPVIHAGEDAAFLVQLFLHIRKLYERGTAIHADLIRMSVHTFLSSVLLIIDDYGELKDREPGRSELINEVATYINQSFREKISLDDIAKRFFVSPYYLTRQFKKETGHSVNQYIQNRRLGEAERKLVFENTPIKEIAAECGYSNLKYFYSVFKTKTGHTPSEFRELLQLHQER